MSKSLLKIISPATTMTSLSAMLGLERSTRSRSATLPMREAAEVVPSLMMFSTGKSLAVAHLVRVTGGGDG